MSARYPIVPDAPGVPPVLRNAANTILAVELLVADAAILVNLFRQSAWGIFDSKGVAIVTGAIVALDYHHEYRVSNYRQENGAFRSYNKVEMPFEGRVSIAVDGSTTLGNLLTGPSSNMFNRAQALSAIEAALSTTDLYSLRTPEATYDSVNLNNFGYSRRSRGPTSMIVLDVGITQIRIAPTPQFSQVNVKSPDAADPENGGVVQPQSAPGGIGHPT